MLINELKGMFTYNRNEKEAAVNVKVHKGNHQ